MKKDESVKKVAIVTIQSYNFGNRLQNYALQEVLTKLGCRVESLRRTQVTRSIKKMIRYACQNVLKTKGYYYSEFDKLIRFSDVVISRDDYPLNLNEMYDYFVSGSDQIWNPNYDIVGGACDFLEFADPYKRVAYAASFGVSTIPEEHIETYSKRLKGYEHISVRENAGAEIVRLLSGRNVDVVLDPTLLLKKEQWERIMRPLKSLPRKPYVLIYALGNKENEFEDAIDYYGSEYEIFDLMHDKSGRRERAVGPAEFLYAVRNAEIVLTDSFHCAVFSILFHRKFYVFNRKNEDMFSRINSLYQNLGIVNCNYKIINLDFDKINKRLEILRNDSIAYLKESLSL